MFSCRSHRALIGLCLLFLFTISAHAQYRAAIQGTIEDPNGAVIPGATVRATNAETGVTRDAVTNNTGFYRISNLSPGKYNVTVSASGFADAKNDNVIVTAEQLRGFDAKLAPAGAQQTVTVTDEGAALQTENADIQGTFSNVEVKQLPQFNRDPYELLRLAPGVFGTGARDGGGNSVSFPNSSGPGGSNSQIFQTENQVQVSANGQRVTANSFQIDGVNVNSQAWGGAAVITPNQESVKEVKVVANSYTAETGRNSGAAVQVVSQNGTNDFHGSAVLKRDSPGLNAFAKWGGPNNAKPQRVDKRFTQWAGSLGGPIIKNHLFFFFSVEGVGSKQNTLDTGWFETPQYVAAVKAARGGTIANTILQFPGMTPPRVANPLTFTCADYGVTDPTMCQEVAGGLDIGSIGGSVGTAVGATGGGLDGVPDVTFAQLKSFNNTTSRQYNGRLDFQVTKSDLVAFSMYFVPSDNSFNAPWANGDRPYGDFTSSRRNMDGALLWTRTLSPSAVNEARFNVTRWYFNEIEANSNFPWGIPHDNICTSQCIGYGPFNPGVFYQTTYNFRDTFTKIVNAHALKFGGDIAREQNNDRIVWAARPSYDFANLWSFANDAPSHESGNFQINNGVPTDVRKGVRTGDYAFFVQDDWKVKPNLTVNLGVRWEYFQPLHTKNAPISNLILGQGGTLTDATLKLSHDLYKGDKNNFGPQLGFAWSPFTDGKTVFRGGYGLGYNRIPESLTLNARTNPGVFASFDFFNPAQIVYSLSSGVKNFYGFPANPNAILTFDPTTGLPNLPGGAKPNVDLATHQSVPTPYTHRYSLEMEQDLGGSWTAALGYQGSSSRKLPRRVNYNFFTTPNPLLGNVSVMLTDVNSNYNALLTRLTHRFAHGYTLNAQYRWSKSLDECSNDDNCVQTYPFAQKLEWGPSDFDVTHSLQMYGTWNLPIFRDQKNALGFLLGGWELSGAVTGSSGFPWTPVVGGPACVIAVAGGNICPVRPTAYLGGAVTDTKTSTFINGGLFPNGGLTYFTLPTGAGATLASQPPGIGRNSFRGPRYFDTDLAFSKRFGFGHVRYLGEAAGLELRAQAFNLFNKLNLAPFGFNSPSTQIDNTQFGKATNALAGRVIEIQARFSF